MKQYTTRRHGFTLVEMLVAAALTMLIMAILAQSFQVAMDSMSHLRAAAELQDRLRSATEVMRTDLMSPHIDDEGVANGRVSAVRFDLNPSILPRAGFFRIDQSNQSLIEHSTAPAPKDYSSIGRGPISPTVLNENHRLLFTARLSGKSRQSLFTAPRVQGPVGSQGLDGRNDNLVQDPLTTYGSRWAIVSWFLVLSGENSKGSNPQPLFNLHRRVKLLAEVQDCFINPASPDAIYYSINPVTGRVNTPQDVALSSILSRPSDMYTAMPDGSDIVLSNVTSFEIKGDYQASPSLPLIIGSLTYPRLAILSGGQNQDFPFDDLPPNPLLPVAQTLRSFDTGLTGGTGLVNSATNLLVQQYRVRALQVKIRIYDPKTMATRQVTIIQEV